MPGRSKLQYLIRNNASYSKWRMDIFKRDHFTCKKCGKKNCKIEAHHKTPFAVILDKFKIDSIEKALRCKKLWDIKNGKTLCEKCHKQERIKNR